MGDGLDLGISLKYETQYKPNDFAEVFIICEDVIGNDNITLILGDVFHRHRFSEILKKKQLILKKEQLFLVITFKIQKNLEWLNLAMNVNIVCWRKTKKS